MSDERAGDGQPEVRSRGWRRFAADVGIVMVLLVAVPAVVYVAMQGVGLEGLAWMAGSIGVLLVLVIVWWFRLGNR